MNSMTYIGRVFSNIRDIYKDINAATLTGAIDVVVIEQPDGSFKCSPFHVRFGKMGVLRSREKVVDISINDEPQNIYMKLGESGEAFFVEQIPENELDFDLSDELSTSPLHSKSHILQQYDPEGSFHSYSENNLLTKDTHSMIDARNEQQVARRNTDTVIDNLRSMEFLQESILQKASDDEETIFNMDDVEIESNSDRPVESNFNHSRTSSLKKKKRKKVLTKKKKSTTSDHVTMVPSIVVDDDSMPLPDPEIHFFSDTELNSNTRPSSPVQSDSELEVSQRKQSLGQNDEASWAWGQLPRVQTPKDDISDQYSRDKNGTSSSTSNKDKRSMLSTVFSFMRHSRKNSNEGIYLTELSSDNMDPKMLAKYFPDRSQPICIINDDMESGNGSSLPLSPESHTFLEPEQGQENDEHNKLLLDNVTLSLCGWQEPPTDVSFLEHIVTFSDFIKNPSVIESNDLVVRILDNYYHWSIAAPFIMSLVVYKRPLPKSSLSYLRQRMGHLELKPDADQKLSNESKSYSWWSWRRKENQEAPFEAIATDQIDESTIAEVISDDREMDQKDDSAEDHSDSGKPSENFDDHDEIEKCRKSLRLSSDQIKNLNLKPGRNKVVFSVTTAYQGTSRCECFIYRWSYNDKIVVSDIDGTITKSDVLGHILPIVGKDWAQTGVAQLFTKIKNNGYKLLYLSARAIGQSRLTRDYLQSIKQDDLTLPDGPILLNPTSLLTAFHGEVIEKKPEKFKISCLSDINALFPSDFHPFYAGYGNKVNDVWSYRSVNIPIERIFTINHKGELKHELTKTFKSSYTSMSLYVDELYPTLKDIAMDYSQFMYWREPIQDIDPKQPKL